MQQVTMSGTTSDSEWQRVTRNDYDDTVSCDYDDT